MGATLIVVTVVLPFVLAAALELFEDGIVVVFLVYGDYLAVF